jgi:hypothetical protein
MAAQRMLELEADQQVAVVVQERVGGNGTVACVWKLVVLENKTLITGISGSSLLCWWWWWRCYYGAVNAGSGSGTGGNGAMHCINNSYCWH